jgi:hypothetical protein
MLRFIDGPEGPVSGAHMAARYRPVGTLQRPDQFCRNDSP